MLFSINFPALFFIIIQQTFSQQSTSTFPMIIYEKLREAATSPLSLRLRSNVITTENVTYMDEDGFTMFGYMAYNPTLSSVQKTVLIVHDRDGRNEYENSRAEQLARLGYVGFAVDAFGIDTTGKTLEANQTFTKTLMQNRTLLLQRLNAALVAVRRQTFVDPNKIAAIGYCFGGLAVLDMARSNFDLRGVASFHGNLGPMPENIELTNTSGPIKPKVMVFTGYNDPGIPPETVTAFQKEMNDRKADWEVNVYGNTVHAFTVPGQPRYSARADKRSWATMLQFFDEIFSD